MISPHGQEVRQLAEVGPEGRSGSQSSSIGRVLHRGFRLRRPEERHSSGGRHIVEEHRIAEEQHNLLERVEELRLTEAVRVPEESECRKRDFGKRFAQCFRIQRWLRPGGLPAAGSCRGCSHLKQVRELVGRSSGEQRILVGERRSLVLRPRRGPRRD